MLVLARGISKTNGARPRDFLAPTRLICFMDVWCSPDRFACAVAPHRAARVEGVGAWICGAHPRDLLNGLLLLTRFVCIYGAHPIDLFVYLLAVDHVACCVLPAAFNVVCGVGDCCLLLLDMLQHASCLSLAARCLAWLERGGASSGKQRRRQ